MIAEHGGGFASKSSRKGRRRPPKKSRSSHGGSFEQRATDSVSHEDAGSYDAYPGDWSVNWTPWDSGHSEMPQLPARGDMGTYDNQFPWIQLGWL